MLYLITLEPLENRYTAQWKDWIRKETEKSFDVVEIHGDTLSERSDNNSFYDFNQTNIWKSEQIIKISNLFRENKIKQGDKFLFYDAWHYGVTALKYMSKLQDVDVDIYGIWHAGSYDKHDLLATSGLSEFMKPFEESLFACLTKSFVATDYHKQLIVDERVVDENKIVVTGLPYDFKHLEKYKNLEKSDTIVFPHRLSKEKQPEILKYLEQHLLEVGINVVFCQEKDLTKDQYHTILGESKVVFSANLQETWGIGCFEGMFLDVIPYVPDRLSYKEMYSDTYKYPSNLTLVQPLSNTRYVRLFTDMVKCVRDYDEYKIGMKTDMKILIDKFCNFKNIIKEMS